MNSRRRLEKAALAAVAVAVAAVGVTQAHPAGPPATYRDGVVLVRFTAASTTSDRAGALAAVGGSAGRKVSREITALNVPHGTVVSAVAKLKARKDVVYAEPDYLQTENAVPNDPSFGLQWGYRNTGQTVNGKAGVAGADEKATPAWDVTTGTRSVVVAEVDSGVDYTHPDLAANIWSNPGGVNGCAAGSHGYNVLTSTCNPMDDETVYGGHGTHVAGIIGAVGNNGVGVTGVNWSTTILPVKWLNSSGNGATSDLITALDWVLQAKQAGVNVRVVNDSATFVGTAPSQALSDEIDLLGQNDILFVTAAGNTGDNNDDPAKGRYPCGYDRPTEICVTASDQTDHLPSWANYGATTVDLAAPGDNVYSTLRNGTYGYISGGSMASPQVAGTAALVLSRGYMPVASLRSDILDNVDPIPALSGLVRTGGRLDVCKAVPGCTLPTPPATFGQTNIGPSSDSMQADRKRVNRYQLPVAATVTKLTVYLQSQASSGQQLIKGVVYADSGGSPGALLGVTSALTFHAGAPPGWYDLQLPGGLGLQPGNYWIGLISGASTNRAAFRWTSVAGSRRYNTNTYTSGPSNPFGAASTDAEQMSIYATYTPASGGSAPVNTGLPTTSGTTQQGSTLTATNGTWSNNPTSFGYQWQRCDSSGNACTPIGGATSSTYPLVLADVGSTIRVAVTASNASGQSTATSAATAVVTPTGTTFGKTTIGAQSDAGTADYKRVVTTSLATAGSVSKLTIYLTRNAAGQQVLKGVVYADQAGAPGALLATSSEVTFGTTATSGWYDLPFPSAVPLSAGAYWIGLIDGATSNVIALRYDSVANTSAVAPDTYADGPTNPFGTPSRYDAEQLSLYATYTPGVSGNPPVNTGLPAISGTTQQGSTLTASNGTWNNSPTSFGYQWQRCDSSGNGCQPIGTNAATYPLVLADVGATIRVAVTASNAYGQNTATSAQTAVVQGLPSGGTLGQTNVGPTPDPMLADRKRVNLYQLPVAGTVTKLTVYLQSNASTGQQVLKGVIYADSGGAPGALLAVSNELTFHGGDAAGWYDLVLPSGLSLQPGSYWIGLISGGTSYTAAFRWTSVSGSRRYNTNTYASGPSDPFGTASTDSEQISIYATYS